MSEHAPAYGTPPHSKSCAPTRTDVIETPEQLQRASKYARDLVELTELVGWWFASGQWIYEIGREDDRTWSVVRRLGSGVLGSFPSWPEALRASKEHADGTR